ncbi:MAG: hypothetical protein ACKVQK_02745 [Burkholderiales bacterium]
MTKPKVPTTKAKPFGQAPGAGRAKAPPPTPQRKAPGRPGANGPGDAAPSTARIPFKAQSRVFQPPQAANGDDDAMGQPQD